MEPITINNLTFAYPGQEPLFNHCDLNISSDWKLGLLGRNGRGKTTLLKILQKQLSFQGSIQTNLKFNYYPLVIREPDDYTLNVLMRSGYQGEQWQIERELNLMATPTELLWQPFSSLSGGEQTRVMLATLFAQDGSFPLLDEPTNHLDQDGRKQIAQYLKVKKTGFIITSHDRDFLDKVIDHSLVIEQHQLVLTRGNYSDYFVHKEQRDSTAIKKNENLLKDIHHLKQTRQAKSQWAQQAENEKKNNSHADKGFIGAKAAKMMKKATIMKGRLDTAIEERKGLLKEIEKVVPLTINILPTNHQPLLTFNDLTLSYPTKQLCSNITTTIEKNDQVLLCGKNGTGKSSIINAIIGTFSGKQSGEILFSSALKLSTVRQDYSDNHGSLRSFASSSKINYDQFLNLLRKLGMERVTFNVPIEEMSMGQQKKVELARSLAEPAHLYLWDEPLNYLDTYNQQQLIQLIQEKRPPMLIVEHDQNFIKQIATKKIEI
ncbi:ABC-F family ATP-binding cassette domain-containing protein [Limosilactobacillus reuteri]|jgi:lincosamide and streptogramin A transport system ATP-binding/permease protein|uniref:ABC-F family ATP-binding cassette domain-containing protein n=1 Tax=Limosilactobacillus reuteri TaxID=1598 RepID=A0A4S2DRE4_LIMRT|nr:ATP-binding cassette domain-containing protein [Limosilactobacillus reuteri]QDR71931.1 ABC-F family ATP-binding cassette domain-containing protein [Limosilactobacillus reuteri]TGY45056.1 ABC-F family ATP-binding cassette domain-containing protein [Limosilactobacillus reuteri]